MSSIRRAYIYVTCAVSLHAVAWALITLLRDLFIRGSSRDVGVLALQIAILVVGLPLFLAHWLWAQRLAVREEGERESVLRRLYLYGTMAGLLGPFAANAFDLLDTLLRMAMRVEELSLYSWRHLNQTDTIVINLVAMAVLALLWLYQHSVIRADGGEVPETGQAAGVRRLYVYGFSAAGLAMTALATISLLRWLMFQVGGRAISGARLGLPADLARLAVGLALWLVFWMWAERLASGPDEEERASVVRRLYQYAAVFISVIGTVTAATLILEGGLKRLFGVSSTGEGGDIRDALSVIIGLGAVWAYHAYSLRGDVRRIGAQPAQAWVAQLYRYLVAAIGLGAVLVGLGGNISLLVRTLAGERAITGAGREVASFLSILLAGLPVWILPWRQAQLAAADEGPTGDEESQSIVRKIYLYLYLFVATMTVLGSGVFIVYQLINLALGGRQESGMLNELGHAIAFSLMAVAVWLYHGSILRSDRRRAPVTEVEEITAHRVTVVDVGDGSLASSLLAALRRELPDLDVQAFGLTPEASAAMGPGSEPAGLPGRLAESDLIVGPWSMAMEGGGGGAVTAEVAQAVHQSPARKLLIPVREEGWVMAGVRSLETKDLVRQAVRSIAQAAAGSPVKAGRKLSKGAIVAIVVAVVIFLCLFGYGGRLLLGFF